LVCGSKISAYPVQTPLPIQLPTTNTRPSRIRSPYAGHHAVKRRHDRPGIRPRIIHFGIVQPLAGMAISADYQHPAIQEQRGGRDAGNAAGNLLNEPVAGSKIPPASVAHPVPAAADRRDPAIGQALRCACCGERESAPRVIRATRGAWMGCDRRLTNDAGHWQDELRLPYKASRFNGDDLALSNDAGHPAVTICVSRTMRPLQRRRFGPLARRQEQSHSDKIALPMMYAFHSAP
jgi:hypothetical protein